MVVIKTTRTYAESVLNNPNDRRAVYTVDDNGVVEITAMPDGEASFAVEALVDHSKLIEYYELKKQYDELEHKLNAIKADFLTDGDAYNDEGSGTRYSLSDGNYTMSVCESKSISLTAPEALAKKLADAASDVLEAKTTYSITDAYKKRIIQHINDLKPLTSEEFIDSLTDDEAVKDKLRKRLKVTVKANTSTFETVMGVDHDTASAYAVKLDGCRLWDDIQALSVVRGPDSTAEEILQMLRDHIMINTSNKVQFTEV